jgi:hypothetical protein
MVTTNYGLAGGTLDSTRLVEAAIPRLLTGIERARLREELEARAAARTPGADSTAN